MRRLLAYLLIALIWPFAAAAQDDRGFLQGLIEDNLSGAGREVRITGFAGALSSRATLEQMTIADDQGIWLTLRGAVLDWNRGALIGGRLEVNTLSADELIITRIPKSDAAAIPSAEAPGFALPELPVSVQIGTLAIDRAELGEALFGAAATISLDGSVSLIDGAGLAKLAVERLDGQTGSLSLDAAYANASQDLKLDLALSEGPDGIAVNLLNLPGLPSVDLTVAGTGTLSDFRADIKLDTDGATRLAGAVTLTTEPRGEGPPLRRFSADIGGDLAPVFAPQYRPFFGDNIQLVATGARRPDGSMNLEQLSLTADSLTLQGQIALAASGLPETLALTGQIADPEGGPVLLPVGASPIKVARVDLEVSFDAALDETWIATVGLIGLDTAGLTAKNLTLSGTGQIRSDVETGNRFTAKLDFMGQGLDLGSPEMTQALGSEMAGKAEIDWQQGTPVKITGLELAGAGVAVTGSGTLDIEGRDLAVTGTLAAEIAEMSPFSGLAGRDVAGLVAARASGSGSLLGGDFDVDLTARAQDLKLSIPQADPLLRGQSTIELVARRDATGLLIQRLAVQGPELTGTLTGKLQSEGSTLQGEARLREVSLVLPQLSGALNLTAEASESGGVWQVKAEASGPGAAQISVDGGLSELMAAPQFDGRVNAVVGNLAAYAALAQRELGGAVDAQMTGRAGLSADSFDIDLSLSSRDLRVGVPQADALLAGDATVDLAASRDASGLRVSRLAVDSPQITGTLSGKLLGADRSVNALATLRDAALVLPKLSGEVRLALEASESGADWLVSAKGGGPGAARIALDGTFSDIETAPRFAGEIEADIGDLSPYASIAGRTLGGALTARVTGSGTLSGDSFDIDLTSTSRDLQVNVPQADALLAGDATVDLAATRDATGLRVSRLAVESPQITGTLSGKLLGADRSVNALATLRDAALVLPKLSGEVQLALKASENGADWLVSANGGGPGAARIALDGTFSDIETAPRFAGEIEADIGDISPYASLAGRTLGGALTARVSGSGAFSGDSFDIDLTATTRDLVTGIPQADALLAGPASLDLTAARGASGIQVQNLALQSPQITANGSGALLDKDSRVDIALALSDTSLLYPQMSGPLRLNANAAETAGVWQVDGNASGPGTSDMTVTGALTDPLTAPAFDGKITLTAGDLRPFSVLARRPLSGAVSAAINGRVGTADKSYDISLTGSSSGLSIGQAEADKLLGGAARYEAKVAGKGTAVVIERLIVATPQLDADIKGDTNGDAINLAYDIRLANLGLFAPGIDGPLQTTGTARQANERWTVDLAASGPAGSRAQIAGNVAADFAQANLDIAGQAPLGLANRFITPNSVTGEVGFDLRLDGRPSLAALSGTVTVGQARAVVPGPGVVLNDIGANIALNGARAEVAVTAAVQGGGRISLNGPVVLDAPYSADMVARLSGVVVTDPNLYKTTVDGDLTVTGPLAGGAALAGTLTLGRTEVQIPSTGLGASGDIPDITHLNEPGAVRATRARAGLLGSRGGSDRSGTGPRYPIDVRIVAANQIFVRGRGLDAELGGALQLTGTTADLVPSGRFDLVRGRLDILGKRLTLEEGFARLQGAFVPFIRLVASTDDGEVRILITIEGEASDPTISFTSEPELPEDEVLARLLFGRGLDQISPLQAAQLASAVATLAGRGGGGVIGRLRENFGLDDLDVTSDAEGGAALRAGKYLGENLYTDVTIGNGTSEINLNLDISRTVTAKGTVSSTGETSLGIFFQRDY